MSGDTASFTGVNGPVHAMLPYWMPVPSALPWATNLHAVWNGVVDSMEPSCTFCSMSTSMRMMSPYKGMGHAHRSAHLVRACFSKSAVYGLPSCSHRREHPLAHPARWESLLGLSVEVAAVSEMLLEPAGSAQEMQPVKLIKLRHHGAPDEQEVVKHLSYLC